METEFKDKKKKLILPTQKPYDKDLPNDICYQRHKTTFGIVSILVLQMNIDEESSTVKMLPWKPLKITEILFLLYYESNLLLI